MNQYCAVGRPFYGAYISQLIRFARGSHVDDLNARNKCLTAKLLKQGLGCETYVSLGLHSPFNNVH